MRLLVARVMSWVDSFHRGTRWVMSWVESIKFNAMSHFKNRFKFLDSNKESIPEKIESYTSLVSRRKPRKTLFCVITVTKCCFVLPSLWVRSRNTNEEFVIRIGNPPWLSDIGTNLALVPSYLTSVSNLRARSSLTSRSVHVPGLTGLAQLAAVWVRTRMCSSIPSKEITVSNRLYRRVANGLF